MRGSYQYVLVVCIRMYPAGGTVDLQWATIEHFRETGSHQHLYKIKNLIFDTAQEFMNEVSFNLAFF